MYVMILEVVVVAILVFVVGPILFVRYDKLCVPWLRLTLRSYSGASCCFVSVDTHPKTRIISHLTSGKFHGPSLINFHSCSTSPHHPTNRRNR